MTAATVQSDFGTDIRALILEVAGLLFPDPGYNRTSMVGFPGIARTVD